METGIKLFLSPVVFAIGFLWPLFAQTLIALELAAGQFAWLVAFMIAAILGTVAQVRGSWIWLRSGAEI